MSVLDEININSSSLIVRRRNRLLDQLIKKRNKDKAVKDKKGKKKKEEDRSGSEQKTADHEISIEKPSHVVGQIYFKLDQLSRSSLFLYKC